jgi:hypothetical protein
VNAQVARLLPAAATRVSRTGPEAADNSDVDSDLNRGPGPARKASQKTSTSDDEEW